MKYYVCEGNAVGDYNASTKARQDVEKILDNNDFRKFFIPTKYGVQENKILKFLQIFTYRKNKFIWDKALKRLKSGDILLIQYPILNAATGLEKIIAKHKKRGIKIVALIHDLDSLRYKPEFQGKMLCKRVKKEDKKVLNACSYIIAHNNEMKKVLIGLGNEENKIIVLKLFDYLVDIELKKIEHKKNEPIIIAGNLSKEKAEYLQYLNQIDEVEFNLYGKGYIKTEEEKNVHYMGAFLPDELLNNLHGSFGLVWDGNSKDTCIGGFGEYLKYNNPHKVSMYLAAGIPVIIWKKAALADFIEKNKLGFTINSLDEIRVKIMDLSEEKYIKILNNIKDISKKLKRGDFLKHCVEELERKNNI